MSVFPVVKDDTQRSVLSLQLSQTGVLVFFNYRLGTCMYRKLQQEKPLSVTDILQTLHRVAAKEREEIKRTTKQKMARRHNREGGEPPGLGKQQTDDNGRH